MTGQPGAPIIQSLDELLEYREVTERISSFLHKRLREHLATLSPLLAPGKVLGKHVGSRESAPRAEEALAEIKQKYEQVRGTPFEGKGDLNEEVLAAVSPTIHIFPYEYNHEATGAKSSKQLSMTSPVRWVLTYGSDYSLSQMRALASGAGERRPQQIKQFLVNALTFQMVLARIASVSQLLGDLRYEISVAALPGLEKLPMVNISVPIPSFRPPDELLLTAVRFSGVPAFIELIDTKAVHDMDDPLRGQVERLVEHPV